MRLDRIAFRYRRQAEWVLRDVTLTVPRGRLIEVTGPNGAGKSTLLRLLAGIARPARGRITGRPARVGYAPERFPVAQPFTARGYLARMAAIRGDAGFEHWADRVGLAALLDTRLPDLSKGSAHKVGLVQALMVAPELLVLDEPFAGLDADTRAALPSLLRDLAADGATVIVSDHQGDLRELPEVIRWQVTGHAVTEGYRPEERAVAEPTPPRPSHAQAARRTVTEGSPPRKHAATERKPPHPSHAQAPRPTVTEGDRTHDHAVAEPTPPRPSHGRAAGPSVIHGEHPDEHAVAQQEPPHVIDQSAGLNLTDGDPPEGHSVVEVVLPTAEADDLITRLTAEGYSARRRPAPTAPRPDGAAPQEVPSVRRLEHLPTGEGHGGTETTATEPAQGSVGPVPRRDATAPGRDGNDPARDRGPRGACRGGRRPGRPPAQRDGRIVIAVVRFQVGGYLRSFRALHPVLALALLIGIMFSSPLGGTPAEVRQGALNALSDTAALVLPICAWAARGLLDTEPDVQRHLTAVAAGRWRAITAGLAGAYGLGGCLALLALAYPLGQAVHHGLGAPVLLRAVALCLLSALAATMLGALTSRVVLPSPATSILVLLGGYAGLLLLGLGPLRPISLPMIEWMRAAHDGPSAFAAAFPSLAARISAWTTLGATGYLWLRRTRL